MGKQQQKSMRSLTGHFLGWGDDCTPHRYIKLATTRGELVVKIAKRLRPQIQDWQPGIWLTLLSQERIDLVTGETTIKVKQLLTQPRTSAPNSLGKGLLSDCRPVASKPNSPTQIRVCQGSSCRRRGSEQICQTMQAYLDRHDLNDRVEIKPVKCLHQCKAAPHAIVANAPGGTAPEKTHYRQLQPYQVKAILAKHFPIAAPSRPVGYNLINKINSYLQKQISTTSSAL